MQNVNLDSSNPDAPSDGWPWSFSTAIAVYSDENALVANNLLPPATLKATMKLSSGESVPYPYDNRYGIDVNKVGLFVFHIILFSRLTVADRCSLEGRLVI